MLASPLQLVQQISCVCSQRCSLHRTRSSRAPPALVGKEKKKGDTVGGARRKEPAQQFYTAFSYNGRGVLGREDERASSTGRGLAAVQVDHNCLVKRKVRRQQSNSDWLCGRFVVQFLYSESRLSHGLCVCVCLI